jgi:hypothetical protein
VEAALLLLALTLLAAYWRHARQTPYPLLQLTLFKVRTFRVSVIGGFCVAADRHSRYPSHLELHFHGELRSLPTLLRRCVAQRASWTRR